MSIKTTPSGKRVRVQHPERQQIEWQPWSLDQLIPTDHRVRLVWQYVQSLDLSPFYEQIDAVEGERGRDPVPPDILFALWMFATIESVSSARALGRLTERDLAYMWICGGISVNHHLLSDFRAAHGEQLEKLLTDTIASLLHQGLVTLDVIAQDGMRVRASAGSSSFRREPTLKEHHRQAREQVEKLKRESENEGERQAVDARTAAAGKRAAEERESRLNQALAELKQLQTQKEKRKKGSGKKARVSTSDPEARTMKMGDGGFRPAYNVQFANDGGARMIVGAEVTNSGSDRGQLATMHAKVVNDYEKVPEKCLVDCGFATKDDITAVEKRGTEVIAPIHGEQRMIDKGTDPHAMQRGDSEQMVAFRERMATEAAKELYQSRPSIAEFPNAVCRNMGLSQFRVRGLDKVKSVVLWYALSFNFLRMLDLGFI